MRRWARDETGMTHDEIWNAIDALAASRSVSVSRLARQAGLDPTTFNRSKRVSADGRLRWPSTESVSKVLAATGATLDEMMDLGGVAPAFGSARVPMIGIAHAGNTAALTADGAIRGPHWREIKLPLPQEGRAVAFKVEGDSMAPLYRDGDMLVVAVDGDIEPGHRVVLRTSGGDVLAKEVVSKGERTDNPDPAAPNSAQDDMEDDPSDDAGARNGSGQGEVVLRAFDPEAETVTYPAGEITWMARIVWASQ